ncbi:ATP-binding protein [Methylorubrum salsuginis]|uniref:ATP-binding protein n=1 Tax=Methylorubrum salsuginis TaxID=414703 RepID=UPI001FCDCAFD|nr:ATP-binding protein [Methylorubrum salsuginis]
MRRAWRRLSRRIGDVLPKGLYARSLIIIIAPVVLLQSVIAYTFMERHWQLVTRRLSSAVTADIAALIDIYETYPQDRNAETITRIAGERLNLDLDILKGAKLPTPGPRPFFSILDEALSDEIKRQIRRPYWIDTVGRSNLIEIRVAIPEGVMRIMARRSQAYASNSHIFLLWMTGSSLVLLGVAILFLRNQIKPILRLSAVAEGFGKGREIEFKPRGAREVRQAGHAFIEMKRRIERAMEQRTTMLNGVSHDLRTIITRFKLSLELVEQTPEVEDLRRDVDEMSRMLEGYLAFARGDLAETAAPTDMRVMLEDLRSDVERLGAHVEAVDLEGDSVVTVRPDAMRRCLFNLAANAARYGDTVAISGKREHRAFLVAIDDDGPGIPVESREEVFKPFVRLDDARQDAGGSGLGLAIARDIARAHGGDVTLLDGPLGGLRAQVRIPA